MTEIYNNGDGSIKERFLRDGYLVLRGVLQPEHDLLPLMASFSRLVDELLDYALDGNVADILPEFHSWDFGHRFATLVGLSHDGVFNHLDPPASIYQLGYRHWQDAPSVQLGEFFKLMNHPRILDVVEQIIGPEITVPAAHHLNIKLADLHKRQLEKARNLPCRADLQRQSGLRPSMFFDSFQMHQTSWHMDEYPGFGDEDGHHLIGVWIPITPAGAKRAALKILPRSHLDGYRSFPAESENDAITLETEPGDIIVMAGKLFHASEANTSADSVRWAFNTRYMPTGHRWVRPFLPGFVARSRRDPGSVLDDAELWSRYWSAGLEFLDRYLYPVTNGFNLEVSDVDKLQEHWDLLVPEADAWLDLHRHGTVPMAMRTSVLRMLERARGKITPGYKYRLRTRKS